MSVSFDIARCGLLRIDNCNYAKIRYVPLAYTHCQKKHNIKKATEFALIAVQFVLFREFSVMTCHQTF